MRAEFIATSELFAFFLLGVVLTYFKINPPKKTPLFRYLKIATYSLFTQLTIELFFLFIYAFVGTFVYSIAFIGILYLLTTLTQFVLLLCIASYVGGMAYSENHNTRLNHIIFTLIYAIYLIFGFSLFFSGRLFYLNSETGIHSHIVKYLLSIDIFVTFIWITGCISKRKQYPIIVFKLLLTFLVLMLIIEVYQFFVEDVVYLGMIYTIPILMLYFTFHNNVYDQESGCQTIKTYESTMEYLKKNNKNFKIILVEVPKINMRDVRFKDSNRKFEYMIWQDCRAIERLDKNIYLYRLAEAKFAILYIYNNKFKQSIIDKIKETLIKSFTTEDQNLFFHGYYINDVSSFDSCEEVLNFHDYIRYYYQGLPKNQWFECTPEVYQEYKNTIVIAKALEDINIKQNLDDERILAYAQPIYNLESKSFKTAESLMRLKINDKVYSPAQFIPVAESTNTIHTLTLIILNKVCQFIKSQSDENNLEAITVNVSSTELNDKNFSKQIIGIINKNQINPSFIRIEITEGGMFDDFGIVSQNLSDLENFGIKFYLDDYGTGYSNLNRIFDLHLHTIKFDKSLLYKAMEDPSAEIMLHTIIDLFKKRHLNILIEGVETQSQLDYSKEQGFQFIQGFYYSKPLPIENLGEYLKENN